MGRGFVGLAPRSQWRDRAGFPPASSRRRADATTLYQTQAGAVRHRRERSRSFTVLSAKQRRCRRKRKRKPTTAVTRRVSAGRRGPVRLADVPQRRLPRADVVVRKEIAVDRFGSTAGIAACVAEGEGFEPSVDLTAHNGFRALSVQPGKPGVEPSRDAGGTSGGTKTGRCSRNHPVARMGPRWLALTSVDLGNVRRPRRPDEGPAVSAGTDQKNRCQTRNFRRCQRGSGPAFASQCQRP
jgi:hypothetical protein